MEIPLNPVRVPMRVSLLATAPACDKKKPGRTRIYGRDPGRRVAAPRPRGDRGQP